jgi:hypothetical protein
MKMRTIRLLCLAAGLLFTLLLSAQDKEFTLEKTELPQTEVKKKLALPQVQKLKAHCAKLGYKDGTETEKGLYKGEDKNGAFQISFIVLTMKGLKGTMDLTYFELIQGKERQTYILAENDDTLYWADKVSSMIQSVSLDDNQRFFSCDNSTKISCAQSVIGLSKSCSSCLKSIKSCITNNRRITRKLGCVLTQSTFACLPCGFNIAAVVSCISTCTE